jgi:putative zinc finger/helix-turn-helix YgiT family protein
MKNARKRSNRNTILPPHCPECGRDAAWAREMVRQTQEFRGDTLEVTAPLRRCGACGFSLLTTEDATALAQATVAAWQQKHGLLTASDIVEGRKKLKVSQKGLAERSRLGSASIKRWESGLVAQTQAHDEVLRRTLAISGNGDDTIIIIHYAGHMEEFTTRYDWAAATSRPHQENWINHVPATNTAREGRWVTA